MSDQFPTEYDRLLQDLAKRVAALEVQARTIPALPITRASGGFELPEATPSAPPGGQVAVYSEDGHFRVKEDDGDIVKIPAANVTDWGGANSTTISGTPTSGEYNTLRADVIAVGNKVNSFLAALRTAKMLD